MNFLKKHAIKIFLIVPILLSFVSSYHLISLFELGNPTWLSIILAVTFELGAIFSFIAISPNFLHKLRKNIILSVFIIIALLQVIGNIYATYDYAMSQIEQNPEHLNNLLGLFMNAFDKGMVGIILSFVLGIVIPLCSLLIFKGTMNYVEVEETHDNQTTEPKYGNVNQLKNEDNKQEIEETEDQEDLSSEWETEEDNNVAQEQELEDSEEVEDENDKAVEEILNDNNKKGKKKKQDEDDGQVFLDEEED